MGSHRSEPTNGLPRGAPPTPPPAPPIPPGTEGLVAAAASGDAAAWEALYRRYLRALRAILRSHMRETSRARFDTEDVLQSTFLAAYEALDDFEYRGPDSFRRWLTRILMHKLFDKLRHHGRAQRDVAREEGTADPLRHDPEDDETPSMILSRLEVQGRLLAAMAGLDIDDQELITLRYFERKTWVEVARELGIAEATARRRLLAALDRLMHRLL
jgi:RNA polymerase sigma-70 factor, ECF subfamily